MASSEIPLSQNHDRWTVIYPVYIDKDRTWKQGRRISQEDAISRPHIQDIQEVCVNHLHLSCKVEMNKAYSRDAWYRGRVRVLMKKDSGAPANPEIKTKRELLRAIGKLAENLPSRAKRFEMLEKQQAHVQSKEVKKLTKAEKRKKRRRR